MKRSLDGHAAPVADFLFTPGDPSSFENVQFNDSSFDPAEAGIATATWELGDGTIAIGSSPTHRYRADGEYRARLTVTTADGRTSSITRIVSVRTHDVAIVKLVVPQRARAGETHPISISVRNLRYPETVQVELFRNGDVEALATMIQGLAAKDIVSFGFAYTFMAKDAAAGTVGFRAIASVVGARDANPADNVARAATSVCPSRRESAA
jgi:PKD repeat protein